MPTQEWARVRAPSRHPRPLRQVIEARATIDSDRKIISDRARDRSRCIRSIFLTKWRHPIRVPVRRGREAGQVVSHIFSLLHRLNSTGAENRSSHINITLFFEWPYSYLEERKREGLLHFILFLAHYELRVPVLHLDQAGIILAKESYQRLVPAHQRLVPALCSPTVNRPFALFARP